MENVKDLFSLVLPAVEEWLRITISQEVTKAIEAGKEREKPQKMYTREEVCELLNISKPTLWARTKSGELKCTKVGRRVLYKESDIKNALS